METLISAAMMARTQAEFFMLKFLDIPMCRERRHALIRAALGPRSKQTA
jgi:hypothetical protein